MMDTPSWMQEEVKENEEVERLIDEQGERESRRMEWNRWHDDPLGLEDGRPGFDWSAGLGSYWTNRLVLRIVVIIVIAIIAFSVRFCVGEERAQEILHGSPVERQP